MTTSVCIQTHRKGGDSCRAPCRREKIVRPAQKEFNNLLPRSVCAREVSWRQAFFIETDLWMLCYQYEVASRTPRPDRVCSGLTLAAAHPSYIPSCSFLSRW